MDVEVIKKKLVGFGCDGASVMVGKYQGVATKFQHLQSSLLVIHCMVHRLELAYKDAIKNNRIYASSITLLMGLYYFYKNSPKMRKGLCQTFTNVHNFKEPCIPKRVGGTRWVSHLQRAVNCFLKGYPAIVTHIEDVVAKPGNKNETSKNKARGYKRMLRRGDILALLHLLSDILRPLSILSLQLQSNRTTVADVPIAMEAASETIKLFKDSNGPRLEKFMEDPSTFSGESLSAPVSDFSANRTALAVRILNSMEERYTDLVDGTVHACRIAGLQNWPHVSDKESIKEFGNEEVKVVTAHFDNVLGDDAEEARNEWPAFRSSLYARYKDKLQTTQWAQVWQIFGADFPGTCVIMDLILSLPAASAENERGFSRMKLTKTNSPYPSLCSKFNEPGDHQYGISRNRGLQSRRSNHPVA